VIFPEVRSTRRIFPTHPPLGFIKKYFHHGDTENTEKINFTGKTWTNEGLDHLELLQKNFGCLCVLCVSVVNLIFPYHWVSNISPYPTFPPEAPPGAELHALGSPKQRWHLTER